VKGGGTKRFALSHGGGGSGGVGEEKAEKRSYEKRAPTSSSKEKKNPDRAQRPVKKSAKKNESKTGCAL